MRVMGRCKPISAGAYSGETQVQAILTLMSSKTITLQDAASRLAEYVARASSGEDFVIEKAGKPLAHLGPPAETSGERVFGQYRGKIHMSADFDEPLADDLWHGRKSE